MSSSMCCTHEIRVQGIYGFKVVLGFRQKLCGSGCRFQLCESPSTAAKQLSAVTP